MLLVNEEYEMRRTILVASHEFWRHLRRPGFVISTVLLPLILGGVLLFITARTPAPDDASAALSGALVGYVDEAGLLAPPPERTQDAPLRAFADLASAEAALREGTIAGFYQLPPDYLAGGPVAWVSEGLDGPQAQAELAALLRAALLRDQPELAARLGTPSIVIAEASGATPEQATEALRERGIMAFVLPYVFAMILYLTIFSSASFLLQSVTEEKENRTIEIMLTTLRPLELLAGKVLGLGLLGLAQVVIWLSAGLLLLRFSGVELATAGLTLPWTTVALLVVYYLLGYLVYGSLLAGVGATVTSMREGSQLMALLIIPCLLPLWFMGAIITRPNSALAVGLSLFPLTAPVTMMIRVPLTPIGPWAITLSMALLAASGALGLWLAARLFRAGTLLAGQRLSAGAVLRALRA
jgi:ABC-2 type transport system permease protein